MTVVLENVTRVVGALPYISDVSLTFEPGTLNVLLGPTLSGKTTLMRLMAGLDAPTTGRVVVDGKDVTGVDVRKRSVAMVYQQFINYPSLHRLREHRLAACACRAGPARRSSGGSREAAELLRLEPYLDRTPLELSGGQQQRTAIARALVKGADLVLLDEPLANLDYKLREELRDELPRIFEAPAPSSSTPPPSPRRRCCSAATRRRLSEGRVTQFGRHAEVYRRPDSTQRVARGVLRSAAQHRRRSRRRTARVTSAAAATAPANGLYAGLPDGPYTRRLPRPPPRR